MKIGFQVLKNNASAASNFGFKLDNGDERTVVQTLIAYVNARGGLAGHRIDPIWFEVDPATTQSYAQLGQEACSAFTEDDRAVAVAGTSLFETENACLSGKGVPAINGSTQRGYSESELRGLPTVVTMGIPPARQAAAVASSAAAQGYLSGKPQVGVVTIDSKAFREATSETLVPALRQSGARLQDSDIVYAPGFNSTSDLSQVASAMQSAVLRFRNAGVTHVVFLTNAASYALLLMRQADGQRATFTYALSANDAPQLLFDQGVSKEQLAGAVVAGWDPYLDVRADKVGTPPPGRSWCNTALKSLTLAAASNAEWIANQHCDAMQLLLAGAERVTGPFTSQGLVAGLGRIGALPTANTWNASISPQHRWAVNGYRQARFDSTCTCFAYRDRKTLPV